MGIKVLPKLECCWSTNQALGCPWISGTMTKNRFMKINQYMHVNDNRNAVPRNQPEHDRIHKVRNLVEHLKSRFEQVYRPGKIYP